MDKLVLFQNDHFSGAWLMFRGPQEYSITVCGILAVRAELLNIILT